MQQLRANCWGCLRSLLAVRSALLSRVDERMPPPLSLSAWCSRAGLQPNVLIAVAARSLSPLTARRGTRQNVCRTQLVQRVGSPRQKLWRKEGRLVVAAAVVPAQLVAVSVVATWLVILPQSSWRDWARSDRRTCQ